MSIRSLLRDRSALYLLCMVVGAVAGLGAIAFEYLTAWISDLALVRGAGYQPAGPRGELHLFSSDAIPVLSVLGLLLMPAVGGLLSCLLCRGFAPEASGHGTDAAIDSWHNRAGRIRGRVPIVKAIASAITLGTGGSGGREGPIAQIGAGAGSWLAQVLDLGDRRRRLLLSAGMAAGVGAIFRAPFAGALFAAEILYRDAELESDVVMPAFLSSAVAYCVFCGWMGEWSPLFVLGPGFTFTRVVELVPYTLLALCLLPAIALYTRFFYAAEAAFRRLPGPRPLVAAFGGLLTGGIAVLALQITADPRSLAVLGSGYGILQQALDGDLLGWSGAGLLLMVALLKIVTTSCTIGAGGSAGVFGPSMVIGGGVGGAVGIVCQQWGLMEHPANLVIVGMCGFFAGAAKTPISTIVMVTEMTGSYRLLLPAMWVCGLTFLLSRRWSLYRSQVPHRGLSPAHEGEYQVALLEKMRVADVFAPEHVQTVPIGMTMAQLVRLIAESRDDYFPVLDEEGQFVGVLSVRDVREFTFDESLHSVATAGDVMSTPPITVTSEDDLHVAMDRLDSKKLDELPVVDAADGNRLLGRLTRRDVGRAYGRRLQELRLQRQAEAD